MATKMAARGAGAGVAMFLMVTVTFTVAAVVVEAVCGMRAVGGLGNMVMRPKSGQTQDVSARGLVSITVGTGPRRLMVVPTLRACGLWIVADPALSQSWTTASRRNRQHTDAGEPTVVFDLHPHPHVWHTQHDAAIDATGEHTHDYDYEYGVDTRPLNDAGDNIGSGTGVRECGLGMDIVWAEWPGGSAPRPRVVPMRRFTTWTRAERCADASMRNALDDAHDREADGVLGLCGNSSGATSPLILPDMAHITTTSCCGSMVITTSSASPSSGSGAGRQLLLHIHKNASGSEHWPDRNSTPHRPATSVSAAQSVFVTEVRGGATDMWLYAQRETCGAQWTVTAFVIAVLAVEMLIGMVAISSSGIVGAYTTFWSCIAMSRASTVVIGTTLACVVLALVASATLIRRHPTAAVEHFGSGTGAERAAYRRWRTDAVHYMMATAACMALCAGLSETLPILSGLFALWAAMASTVTVAPAFRLSAAARAMSVIVSAATCIACAVIIVPDVVAVLWPIASVRPPVSFVVAVSAAISSSLIALPALIISFVTSSA